MQKRVVFRNSRGQNLVGVLHAPTLGSKRVPSVIICHGFLANKDWKFIPAFSQAICEEGFAVLRFDFTGNGESEGKLTQGTYSQEISDLKCAINFLETVSYVDKKCIVVVGHSMGGAVATIAASQANRIKVLIPIATPAYVGRFKERNAKFINDDERLQKHGTITVTRPDGSVHEITKKFIDDAMKHEVLAAAKKVVVPSLVIHGELDKTVPISEGKEIFASLGSEIKEILIIKNAKHNFAKPEFEQELAGAIIKFLRSLLVV